MPRGAQIMYPKDIAQVIQLGDIRSTALAPLAGEGFELHVGRVEKA